MTQELKKGPGRPKLPGYVKKTQMNTKLPPFIHAWLYSQQHKSYAELIEEAMVAHFKLEQFKIEFLAAHKLNG